MKAYKGFNKDMTCRGFQYKEGETYETDERCSVVSQNRRQRKRQVKYVTYYYTFLGGLSDVEVHDNKDDAVKFYRKAAHGYFWGLSLPKKTTPPTACGFPHRRFGIMSVARFKKVFPEYFKAQEGSASHA